MSPESAPSSSQSTPGFHQLSWNARCQPLPPALPHTWANVDTSELVTVCVCVCGTLGPALLVF